MDKSSFVGAERPSNHSLRESGGVLPTWTLGNRHIDLGPGSGACSGPWVGSSPPQLWFEIPGRTLT